MWLSSKKQWSTTLNVKAIAKGRPRITRKGWAYTPKKTKDAEDDIKRHMLLHNPPRFEGPIAISVRFWFKPPKVCKRKYPSVRPDCDNLAKTITDAANGILYHDDGQIVQLYVQKSYGPEDKITIQVVEIA